MSKRALVAGAAAAARWWPSPPAAATARAAAEPRRRLAADGTTLAPLPNVPMQQALGEGEGALNIIAWAGYAENGSTDPAVDWVTPFEEQTGCKVNVKIGNTSDEMVQLMKTGQYDGVSASGDATLRLIDGGDVAPVNTDLRAELRGPLAVPRRTSPTTRSTAQMYGIPHGWGANLLMYNTDVVTPAPDSWGAVFDARLALQGQGHGLRLADLHRRRRRST